MKRFRIVAALAALLATGAASANVIYASDAITAGDYVLFNGVSFYGDIHEFNPPRMNGNGQVDDPLGSYAHDSLGFAEITDHAAGQFDYFDPSTVKFHGSTSGISYAKYTAPPEIFDHYAVSTYANVEVDIIVDTDSLVTFNTAELANTLEGFSQAYDSFTIDGFTYDGSGSVLISAGTHVIQGTAGTDCAAGNRWGIESLGYSSRDFSITVSSVPEPCSLAALAFGGLLLRRRRR